MSLDEKSKSAEAENAGDDDVDGGGGTGPELKRLNARLGKVEKSVRETDKHFPRPRHFLILS